MVLQSKKCGKILMQGFFTFLRKNNIILNFIFFQERRSNMNRVFLLSLNLKSAGNYRCEVSAEAPLFNTVSQRSRLSVVVLPKTRPRISGGQKTYHVGDFVRVNCT